MADGRIKIAIEVDGKQVNIVTDDLKDLESAGKKSGDGVKQTEQGLKGVDKASSSASGKIKKFATALGLVAIGAAAFKTLKASMDDAISRFDTLNSFPKVLQALGVSAEDSERAMQRLSDGIDGLPTKLDDIASTAQRMYTSFNDMDKATDTALALNNALLGSGASAEDAQRGTEQYIQALQRGHFEMEEWKTLQETMDVGLIKVAEGFGFAGKSAKQDLYNALKDGTITMDQFNDKLIEVGTGTGIMAKLAKENSLGIATSLSNLRNAFAKGIADILDRFNNLSKEVTGKDIAQNIDSLKGIVNASFNAIGSVIEKTTPVVTFFADGVKATVPIVQALSPAIIGLMAAYAGHAVITKASAAISASNAVLNVAMASTNGLTLATKAHTTATATNAGVVKLSTLAIGVMTGKITLATAAKTVATAASYAFGTALRFLTGPVGWVTAGIGALAGATVAVVKWFKRETEEAKRLNAETETLAESTDQLTDGVESNTKAYQDQQRDLENSAKANENLAQRIQELADKESKSAAEKALLASYVDQLNDSVGGLNLSYNENADALSMSSEELQTRLDLMHEEDSLIASQERLLEIDKERNEVQMQLDEINDLREEWNQKLEEGTVKSGEYQEAIANLNEQEQALKGTLGELEEQQAVTEEQITTSMEAITEATEQGIASQKLAYEDLSETQQQVVDNMKTTWNDYKDAATDMFNTLSDEVEITASEMADNLEENQRIISEWADNISILAERGVDEGLLDKLREAGPESAGHVNALVNASDEELERLNEVFSKGGETATDALATSLGVENSNIMDALGNLVTDTEKSLREQIKSADFESIGVNVGEGLASGIDNGSSQAEKASKKMADNTTNAAKNAFQTRSPSRVFKGIGGDVADGLALGISEGATKVVQAVQKMFRNVQMNSSNSFKAITKNYDSSVKEIERTLGKLPKITQKSMKNMLDRMKSGHSKNLKEASTLAKNLPVVFNRTPSQLRSVGLNAMAGLNAGLNAGRGRVMATARSIANSVASTMRSALRIHSPSRVMRDEVGKWIPAGLAEGIEKYADLVDKATMKMFSYTTPEMVLGTSRMAYNGVGYSVNNYSSYGGSKTINNHNQPIIHIEKIENHSDSDIPRILEESAWILSREDKRL